VRQISLLVVDDEPQLIELYREILNDKGYVVTTATSVEQARKSIDREFFDLLLLDERMPGISGTEFLAYCRSRYPGIGGIFITGHADVNSAVRAFRAGAIDLLQKPVDKKELLAAVERALTESQVIREQRYSRHTAANRTSFAEIIGDSEPLRQVLKQVRQVIPTNVPVLIQGESGTGKELLARALHYDGPRKDKPFIAVNVAAMPESLIESMLFGHKKGAFTGATEDRRGYFEAANGGSIFLDEIGEMTADAQVRLLRVLEQKTIIRLGDTREIRLDARFIAATNRNLLAEVEAKRFRLDLLYRLNVMTLTVPPLRSRQDDIAALATYFVDRHQVEIGKSIKSITPDAMEKLRRYHWPGNIRELQNVIQRAIILAEKDVLTSQDILLESQQETGQGHRQETTLETETERQQPAQTGNPENSQDGNQAEPASNHLLQLPFREAEKRFEQQYFGALLARANGNKTKAAKLAGLDRTVLYQHLSKLADDGD